MIGIEKCQKSSTMINEVNTMTPRQNDLVVKKDCFPNCWFWLQNSGQVTQKILHSDWLKTEGSCYQFWWDLGCYHIFGVFWNCLVAIYQYYQILVKYSHQVTNRIFRRNYVKTTFVLVFSNKLHCPVFTKYLEVVS